ncbi:MAG TPA: efflux RND transporter periplasmic adaptor subunit, partial [Tepidisphaeraceae bacterium]|nr:efflux RND transporter periplasmic adaptor subunit [Tepidisphaeraceae bacterium]
AVAIDRERHEGSVAEAEAAAQRARIRQMTLRSPVEGFVERIEAAEGGVTDPQKPSITIVRLNPLDVEIKSLTPDQVSALRLGQSVQVRYPGEQDWSSATVKFIAPVVDARSGTQVVKLSLPNPDLRYAGLRVEVRLPTRASAEAGSAPGVAGTR